MNILLIRSNYSPDSVVKVVYKHNFWETGLAVSIKTNGKQLIEHKHDMKSLGRIYKRTLVCVCQQLNLHFFTHFFLPSLLCNRRVLHFLQTRLIYCKLLWSLSSSSWKHSVWADREMILRLNGVQIKPICYFYLVFCRVVFTNK